MPSTPGETHDETTVIPSSIDSHTQHTTCPPDEAREQQTSSAETVAAEEPRLESILNATSALTPTPEGDMRSSGSEEMDTVENTAEKHTEDVDERSLRDTNSPAAFGENGRDSDTHLAQSMSEAALSSSPPQIWPIEREGTQRVRLEEAVAGSEFG